MSSADSNELTLAYRTTDIVEARWLAAELEKAGVETHILGDYRDAAYAGMTIGSMSNKEIWISARDRETAERIVTEWLRQYHPKDLEPIPPLEPPRYSLKAMLVAMTIVALICGAIAGPQAFQVVVFSLPFVLFVVLAWKKYQQARYDGDDEAAESTP